MKRVCIIRQKYWPNKNVVRNAEALIKAGYEVDVICLAMKGQKKRETVNGINVHRLSLAHQRGNPVWYILEYSAFFLLAFLKLSWLSLKKRYDVVEVDTMPDFLVFVTLFSRVLGSKVILYMYENMPALFISTFGVSPNHIAVKLLKLTEKVSASYAHHVITSEDVAYKRILESRGIASEKITVVLNVPDDAIFNTVESIAPSKDGQHFRLVVASTLVKRYGVQTLVKAVPSLVEAIPELRIDVTGEGEYRPELEKMARNLGVDGYFNFTGIIPYEEVALKISEAHVAVAPMIVDVGLPNKLFEYFAMSKPVVVSALPSLLNNFKDGHCVVFFQPGDEIDLADRILELYHSPENRASIGINGRAFYNHHEWSVMKNEYLNAYKKVLRQAP